MTGFLRDLEKLVPDQKPLLSEVAAMPFPVSMLAMRRYYHKDWHKPEPDGENPGKWSVEIDYTYRSVDSWSCEIEAVTEEEAKQKAEAQFDNAMRWQDDVDVQEITAEFQETAQ